MTKAIIRAIVLVTIAAAIPIDIAAAASAFDGPWEVAVVAQRGCDVHYNFTVQIADGVITLAQVSGLDGHVAPDGTVKVSVTASGTHASGSGKLARSAGRGQWTSRSSGGVCSGYWTARRQ